MTKRQAIRALVTTLAAAGTVILASCGGGDSRSGRGELSEIGDTVDLVPQARWPVRWKGPNQVVFQTWTGFATATLSGEVNERDDPRALGADPNQFQQAAGIRLRHGDKYGRWTVWDGGRSLIDDHERCSPPLALSPDGRYIACVHVISDPLNETSEAYGAVIRIR